MVIFVELSFHRSFSRLTLQSVKYYKLSSFDSHLSHLTTYNDTRSELDLIKMNCQGDSGERGEKGDQGEIGMAVWIFLKFILKIFIPCTLCEF